MVRININPDYDIENAFWVQSGRKSNKSTQLRKDIERFLGKTEIVQKIGDVIEKKSQVIGNVKAGDIELELIKRDNDYQVQINGAELFRFESFSEALGAFYRELARVIEQQQKDVDEQFIVFEEQVRAANRKIIPMLSELGQNDDAEKIEKMDYEFSLPFESESFTSFYQTYSPIPSVSLTDSDCSLCQSFDDCNMCQIHKAYVKPHFLCGEFIEKQQKLIPKTVLVHRGGKVFERHIMVDPEHMREIGKKGFQATAAKIKAMMNDPEADSDEVYRYASWLARRVKQTTPTYRQQWWEKFKDELKSGKAKDVAQTVASTLISELSGHG